MDYTDQSLKNIQNIVQTINSLIDGHSPVDYFQLLKFDGKTLTLCGSADYTYYHNIEIKFSHVYYFSGEFITRRNPELPFITIVNTVPHPNTPHCQFRLACEGEYNTNFSNELTVASEGISYNNDTVYYYNRPNLKVGERLADWIT